MDLSSHRVTGADNPSKQVSVTRWNGLLESIEDGTEGFVNVTAQGESVAGVSDNIVAGGIGTFAALTADPARLAWDAHGASPSASGNDLELSGHQIAAAVNSAVIIGGRGSYYSAVGSEDSDISANGYGSLTLTYGGDNWNNHLAGMLLSMHSDLIQGTGSDGVTLKGSHGAILGGSFHQVAGDYSGSFCGQRKQVYALQSVALGGLAIKIGGIGDVEAVRRAGTVGGYLNEITAGYQGALIGGESNSLSADNAVIIGGESNTVSGAGSVVLGGSGHTVSAADTVALGRDTNADLPYAVTQSNGKFADAGDNQVYRLNLRREFTAASGYLSHVGGSGSDIITVPSDALVVFDAVIGVARTDTPGETASYKLCGSCTNIGGSLAIKGQSLTVIHEDDAAYTAAAEIVGTGTRLGIKITTPSALGTYRANAAITISVLTV